MSKYRYNPVPWERRPAYLRYEPGGFARFLLFVWGIVSFYVGLWMFAIATRAFETHAVTDAILGCKVDPPFGAESCTGAVESLGELLWFIFWLAQLAVGVLSGLVVFLVPLAIRGLVEIRQKQAWDRDEAARVEVNRKFKEERDGVRATPIRGMNAQRWAELKAEWNHRCAYCGEPSAALHKEHVIPLEQRGRHHIDNIVPSCPTCNYEKGTLTGDSYVRRRRADKRSVNPDWAKAAPRFRDQSPPGR